MQQSASSSRYHAYHQASQTLAKTRQVVMLYDGAIRFLAQAKDAALTGDAERRYLKLTRVCDILSSLQSALDMGAGEGMATRLHQYYDALILQVLHLHYALRAEDFTRVQETLKTMREVWDAVDRGASAPQASVAVAARQLATSATVQAYSA